MGLEHELILPERDISVEPLCDQKALEAKLAVFEGHYAGATWRAASDEAMASYLEVSNDAARHLILLHYDVASMIYQGHVPMFENMGDGALLCAVACLHFSRAKNEEEKKEVMAALDRWTAQTHIFYRGNSLLSERLRRVSGQEKAEQALSLRDQLHDLYRFYLDRPDWG